ncbi:MAG: acyltransferase family protein [Dokdonella sp.]|uniref:acyltransferase family protein n=1 Tax=Dokdonella sp. TaxID=2291710 RepID=UPI003F7D95F0
MTSLRLDPADTRPEASAPAPMDLRLDGPVTSPRTEAGAYRPDIDGLRAVAILAVLAFHAFPQWMRGGFTGVDVFFVISGFLISRIVFSGLVAGTFSFRHFYARRARRIFPSLAVILFAALGLGWLILRQLDYAQLGKHVAAGAGFVSNIALWVESGYFDGTADAKPLLHLWSLGIEEQFYIAFPLLVFVAWRVRAARMPLLLIVAAASFAANLWLVPRDGPGAFYLPHARFWELAAGCLLAYAGFAGSAAGAPGPWNARWTRDAASIGGAIFVAAGLLLIDAKRPFPGWWAVLPVAGSTALIWAGPEAIVNRHVLACRPMVWIGLISFQLYLWHWPLLAFVHIARPEDSDAGLRALAIAVSFPLAWATHAWIDKPVRTGSRSRIKVAGACAVLAVAGLAGWSVYRHAGFPARTPDTLTALAAFKFEYAVPFREGECFLRPEQDFRQFRACTTAVAGSPPVVLWGDSHAGHLYPGLEAVARGRFTLTQLTASGCPPILDVDSDQRPFCRSINDAVFARIARERPAEVVLSAYWPSYAWQRLPATIDRLLAAGVGRVLVVGPGPLWPSGLPGILYARAKADVPAHRMPRRLPTATAAQQKAFDQDFAKLVARPGVAYVSMLSILCDGSGCLTRTRDDASSIMFYDIYHMTVEGSVYAVAHFPEGSLPSAH